MTKYVVFVNEFNKNADESISFDVTFDSLKEVLHYINSLTYEHGCCGHVEKWSKCSNDKYFTSDLVMRF